MRSSCRWLAAALFALCLTGAGPPFPRLRLGDPLPDLELPELGRGRLRLRDFRGRVLAMSFYSRYCAPCRRELPTLVRVLDRVNRDLPPARNVLGLVIAVDTPPEAQFHREIGPRLRWLLDAGGKARAAFDPRTYPCTFLVDSDGRVRHINRGYGPGYETRVEGWLRSMLLPARKPGH